MSDTPSQPDDELKGSEQPFVAHLIELRDRLMWAVAAVAVANKNARIVWALLARERQYETGYSRDTALV